MPRTRAKSPPRLTRDAERLIALANGLNASGSVTEDRYWESQVSALASRLLENGNDAPIEGAIDHLPRQYSELRRLAARLGDSAVSGEVPRIDLARLPETAHLLADTRFLVACAAVPRGQPLFRWQEDASGHTGRTGALEQWISQARPTLSRLLPGCVFECLLPDAYYVNCRESDRRVRPFGIRAAAAFLENALAAKPA